MVAGHATPFEIFSMCRVAVLPNNVIYLFIFQLFLISVIVMLLCIYALIPVNTLCIFP